MTKSPLPPTLARFLKLWPGLIAVFSLLTVWSTQVTHPEGPRTLMSAAPTALPELRAIPAPTPTPGPGLLTVPEEQAPLWVPGLEPRQLLLGRAQQSPTLPDLTALGRQQTDGG